MQLNCRRTFPSPMQLTQLNSIQPISAKQVSRVFVDLVLASITVRVLSIVDLTELFYLILLMLNKVWPTNSPVNKQPLQLSLFRSWSVLTVNLQYTHHDTKIATARPAVGVILQNFSDRPCAVNSLIPKHVYLFYVNLNCISFPNQSFIIKQNVIAVHRHNK